MNIDLRWRKKSLIDAAWIIESFLPRLENVKVDFEIF